MNSKEGNWLAPQRNAFIGIDILRFFKFFFGFPSFHSIGREFKLDKSKMRDLIGSNLEQFFGVSCDSQALNSATSEKPFTHSGSGNLSVEFYNFPADEFAWCALQFHLI